MAKKGIVILLVLLLTTVPAYAVSGFASDPDLIEEAALSVLMLEVYDSSDELIATGSGFVAFDNKTLITNYHVIEDAYVIVAYSDDGYQYIVNKVLVANTKKDIAICGFFSPTNLIPLELNTDGQLKRAESVVAIGSPIGITNTVSLGNISAIYEDEEVKWVQFTAPISSGSSGGALFDGSGRVIGVTSATYIEAQNINLAVHISEVRDLYEGWNGESYRLDEYSEEAKQPSMIFESLTTEVPTDKSLPEYPTLKMGDRGENVHNLQLALIKFGYMTGRANGIFDSTTERAVKLFNVCNHTMAGEFASSAMQRMLFHGNPVSYYEILREPEAFLQTVHPIVTPCPNRTTDPLPRYEPLLKGNSGEAVVRLQEALAELGYFSGKIDGVFGAQTEEAVILFNEKNGVNSDVSDEKVKNYLNRRACSAMQELLYHGKPLGYE